MGILILPIVTMNLSLFISISFVLNLLLKSLFLHVFACFSSIWTIFLSVLFCMGSALIYLSFSFHPSLLLFPLFLFPWLTLPFFSFTFDSYVFSYLFFFPSKFLVLYYGSTSLNEHLTEFVSVSMWESLSF